MLSPLSLVNPCRDIPPRIIRRSGGCFPTLPQRGSSLSEITLPDGQRLDRRQVRALRTKHSQLHGLHIEIERQGAPPLVVKCASPSEQLDKVKQIHALLRPDQP